MTSPVDVVNLALDQIGARATIQSIDPPAPSGVAAEAAARHYQHVIDSLSRAANWSCLRYQATLTLLKAASGTPENPNGSGAQPPVPWLYSYAVPTDPYCLKVRYVIPNTTQQSNVPILSGVSGANPSFLDTAMPFAPATDTDTNGNLVKVILTNAPNAQAVYTARIVDPDLWDAQFLDCAITVLSVWLVNPVVRNKELLQERAQAASALITQARVSDGNESITAVDHLPDFIRVRGYGGPVRIESMSWDTISFPDGTVI